MTTSQIAARLGIRSARVRRLIHAGTLPAVNLSAGRRPTYLVAVADLDALLEARRVIPGAASRREAGRRRKTTDALGRAANAAAGRYVPPQPKHRKTKG